MRRRRTEAEARMAALIRLAVAAEEPVATIYAKAAWQMATRHRLRMPYQMRMMFCKRCKMFIPPGRGSRVRLGSGPRAIRITCRYCSHTYRKVLGHSQPCPGSSRKD